MVFRSLCRIYRPIRAFTTVPQSQSSSVPHPFQSLRTLGNTHQEMDTQISSLAEKLNYVMGGKAHRGYFDGVKVYSFMEWVPLPAAATVTAVSDSELSIEAYEPSNSPLVELAIRKSGVQAEVTRDFGVVKVKILGYDKEAALKEARRLGDEAKEALLSIKEKTAARVGKDAQALGKLEAVTQARIRMVDELVAIKEESLV